MDTIQRQVRRAWRRLALQQFLWALGWSWFVALSVALLVMAAARFWPLPERDGIVVAVALAVGLAVALTLAWRRSPRTLGAAWEIDRRFGLKDRVSSTLAMNAVERQSDAGQALVADADARLKRLNLNERFTLAPPRQTWLPLLPAALALLIMLRPVATPPVQAMSVETPVQQAEVQTAVKVLREQITSQRQKADKADLAASELLKKIDDGTKEILAQPSREKALVKLNQLENLLKERQKALGGVDAMKRQLEQLKSNEPGPADKLAKAMARGDFKQAAEALDKLKQELAKSGLDEKQKENLAKQLESLQKKLDKMAEQANEARNDMQKRADEMSTSGDAASSQKLQDQIDQLMQKPQSQSLQQLSDALGQCVQSMKQGNKSQAAKAMQQALNQMKSLAKQSQELATVDSAMRQIAAARNRMNCPKCGGAGGKECQGEGEGKSAKAGGKGKKGGGKDEGGDGQAENGAGGGDHENMNNAGDDLAGEENTSDNAGDGNADGKGDMQDLAGGGGDDDNPIDPKQKPGNGGGRGRGNGARPEKDAQGKFYDSTVKQNVGKGAAMVTDMVEGPNLKGHAMVEIQKETTAVQQGSTDPLSGQRLPKQQAKFAREYFDRIRDDGK